MIKLDGINIQETLRYLQSENISPDSDILRLINNCEQKLLKVIEPRYLYSTFDISHTDNSIILDNCTLVLNGKDIRNHLKRLRKGRAFLCNNIKWCR